MNYMNVPEFNSFYYGLSVVRSFSDVVGWELWGGYGLSARDYGSSYGVGVVEGRGISTVQRSDISFMPRLQKAIPLGDPVRQIYLIPHFGLGPVYSYISVLNDHGFYGGSALGGGFSVGLDFQFGQALLGLKYRHLMSVDTSGTLGTRDINAGLSQLNLGWAF